MRIKMLRKNDAGETEVFYVDSFEEKQLYDSRRKMWRKLEHDLPESNDAKMKKQALHQRQMSARELRVIVTEINKLEVRNGPNE